MLWMRPETSAPEIQPARRGLPRQRTGADHHSSSLSRSSGQLTQKLADNERCFAQDSREMLGKEFQARVDYALTCPGESRVAILRRTVDS